MCLQSKRASTLVNLHSFNASEERRHLKVLSLSLTIGSRCSTTIALQAHCQLAKRDCTCSWLQTCFPCFQMGKHVFSGRRVQCDGSASLSLPVGTVLVKNDTNDQWECFSETPPHEIDIVQRISRSRHHHFGKKNIFGFPVVPWLKSVLSIPIDFQAR